MKYLSFLFVCCFAFVAQAAPEVLTVASIAKLQSLGAGAAAYPSVNVVAYTAGTNVGGGLFAWSDPCPAAATDYGIYIFPTGVSGKCFVRQTDGSGKIASEWFGTVPNNTGTDYTVNFQRALAAGNAAVNTAAHSYYVTCAPGKYILSAQLVVAAGEHFGGTTSWDYGCQFFPSTNFTGLNSGGAIVIGDGTNAIFGSIVENVSVQFQSPGFGTIAGSVGMTAYNCQDQCGFRNVLINGWSSHAAQMIGAGTFNSVDTYVFENVASLGAQSGGTTGPAYLFKSGTYPGHISNADALCYPSNCPTNMIEFDGLPAILSNTTIEGPATVGLKLDSNVPTAVVTGLTALCAATDCAITPMGSAVSITAGSVFPAVLTGIYAASHVTNSILDGGGGTAVAQTITDQVPAPYFRGRTTIVNSLLNTPGLPTTNPGISTQLWTNTAVVTRVP